MRRRIRLTESDLHRIVEESVNQILISEGLFDMFRGRGNSQGQRSAQIPNGFSKNWKDVCNSSSAYQQYCRVMEFRTNIGKLYCAYDENDMYGKNASAYLERCGIKVDDAQFLKFENPDWNGRTWDKKTEKRTGYGDTRFGPGDFVEMGSALR